MTFEIREMTIDDYEAAFNLWKVTEGMGLSRADERDAIEFYLCRNPGTSFIAVIGTELVGTVLAGHDGRRGFLHHLAVSAAHRRMGIGRALAQRCLQALKAQGIEKSHLFVYESNHTGRDFWKKIGWYERPELVLMSINMD